MEVKKKVSVFLIGDLPLAVEVAKLFNHNQNAIIEGMLVQYPNRDFLNDPFIEKTNLYNFAKANDIKVFFSVEDVIKNFKNQKIDVGIS